MKTTKQSLIIVLISTIFTSIGQIGLKKGADALGWSIGSLIFNKWLLLGIIAYGIGAVLYVMALKNGELIIIFPLIATSFIWVSFLSMYFLHESMNLLKWGGIGLILIGVSIMGYASQRNPRGERGD